MTHYQKLAALIFRVIATLMLAIGLLALVFGLGAFLLIDRRMGVAIGVIYGPPFLLLGWGLYSLSIKLARWVCDGFEKAETPPAPMEVTEQKEESDGI